MGTGCPGSDGGRELFPGHTYGASKLGHGVRTWWSPYRECQSARNVTGREDKFPQRHWGINAGRQPWEQKWRLQSVGQWCYENLWFRCLQYNSLRHEVLMTHVNLLFIYFFKKNDRQMDFSVARSVKRDLLCWVSFDNREERTYFTDSGCGHCHPSVSQRRKATPFL